MRILQTIHTVNPATGGTAEAVLQLAQAHRQLGHTVEIASLDRPSDPWVEKCPVPIHALGPGRGSFGYSPRLIPWLRERAADFEVIVANGFWQHHTIATAAALRGTGTPYFLFAHGMLDVWFRRTYPLKHCKKCLYWWLWQHRAMEQAAAVIFTSEEEWRRSRISFTPFHCRKAVIPLGITPPPAEPERQRQAFFDWLPAAKGRRILLFLGRIHEKKGCDLLVEAVQKMRTTERWKKERYGLVFLGPCADASYRARLEARSQNVEGENDVFWGEMVSGDAKWGAFRAADAFILPSHQENFGVAVIEALACGVPVLLSDQVNIWREIAADGAGLIAPDDLAGTTQLLERWMEESPEEQSAMRQRATQCFSRRFQIQRSAEKLVELFARSLPQKQRTTTQGSACDFTEKTSLP